MKQSLLLRHRPVEAIIREMIAIPKPATSLSFMDNTLNGDELAKVLRTTPDHITSLSFNSNRLAALGVDALVRILKELPTSITSLDLSSTDLAALGEDGLVRLLEALPSHVTSLNLGANNLHILSAKGLARVLEAIVNVTSLGLSLNKLSTFGGEGLAEIGRAISRKMKTLNLAFNDLSNVGVDALIQGLQTLENVASLNLALCDLYRLGGEGLARVLEALPANITSLDLGYNFLEKLGEEGLIQLLTTLPTTVTSLNLKGNYLYLLKDEGLVRVLAAIPASITSLDLSSNNLSGLGAEKLIEVFKSIPKDNLTEITLSLRDVEGLDRDTLIQLGSALSVSKINLVSDRGELLDRDELLKSQPAIDALLYSSQLERRYQVAKNRLSQYQKHFDWRSQTHPELLPFIRSLNDFLAQIHSLEPSLSRELMVEVMERTLLRMENPQDMSEEEYAQFAKRIESSAIPGAPLLGYSMLILGIAIAAISIALAPFMVGALVAAGLASQAVATAATTLVVAHVSSTSVLAGLGFFLHNPAKNTASSMEKFSELVDEDDRMVVSSGMQPS